MVGTDDAVLCLWHSPATSSGAPPGAAGRVWGHENRCAPACWSPPELQLLQLLLWAWGWGQALGPESLMGFQCAWPVEVVVNKRCLHLLPSVWVPPEPCPVLWGGAVGVTLAHAAIAKITVQGTITLLRVLETI